MTYCFKCTHCDATVSGAYDLADKMNVGEPHTFIRDFRAENVAPQLQHLKKANAVGTNKDIRDKFLPTARDYMGPNDPDGSKGIRDWNDRHEPRAGNGNPLRPEIPGPKTVF